jgi:hypothetical protein
MTKRRSLKILFISGWAMTASLLIWIHRSAALSPDELNVCETVFRYEIESLEKAVPGQISTYYLSVEDANPPRNLLARLRASNLRVQQGSLFYPELWSKGAWHFVIRGFEQIDGRTFLVHGGYENNGLSAAGEDYTVINNHGQWKVEKVVGRWAA